MSRYKILSNDPVFNVYVGWDPSNRTYFIQVLHWSQEEDDYPFLWKGIYPNTFKEIDNFISYAGKYAHFSHYAIQVLLKDKMANSSKNNSLYDYLGNNKEDSPYSNVYEESNQRFERIFIDMGCRTIEKTNPTENIYDFYFQTLYGEKWMARKIFGKETYSNEQANEVINIMKINNLDQAIMFSYHPFKPEVKMIANNHSISLLRNDDLKSFANFCWKISENVNKIIKYLQAPYYFLDYGIGPEIDNSGTKGVIREIGRKLNELGGFTAMQSAFYVFSSRVNDPKLPRELEIIWNGIGEWKA